MCLTIEKKQQAKIAEEDIECYKLYIILPSGTLISFYQHSRTELGVQPKVKIRPEGLFHFGMLSETEQSIEEGYHSFTDLKEIKRFLIRKNIHPSSKDFGVFKCIIPKDSRYYLGTFNNEFNEIKYNSYASQELIVKEKISLGDCWLYEIVGG